jgi:hypothetical protein
MQKIVLMVQMNGYDDNEYDIEYYIEHNEIEKGIGGGMDFCVDKSKQNL